MKKTYTIFYRKSTWNYKKFMPLAGLQQCLKSFAQGAMSMAKQFYGGDNEFICKCDQTDEIIDSAFPRHLNINHMPRSETVITSDFESAVPGSNPGEADD